MKCTHIFFFLPCRTFGCPRSQRSFCSDEVRGFLPLAPAASGMCEGLIPRKRVPSKMYIAASLHRDCGMLRRWRVPVWTQSYAGSRASLLRKSAYLPNIKLIFRVLATARYCAKLHHLARERTFCLAKFLVLSFDIFFMWLLLVQILIRITEQLMSIFMFKSRRVIYITWFMEILSQH